MTERIAESAAQLGRGIRKLRKKMKWTQDQLSAKSGINRATISILEGGKSNPSFILVEELSKAFGTSVAGVMMSGRKSLRLTDDRLKLLVGKNVKSRRLALGLSRKELGQHTGLMEQYIGNIENSISLPNLTNFLVLVAALELPASILLTEELFESAKVYSNFSEKSVDEIVGRLKMHRTNRGLTVSIAAAASGLNINHLSNIEGGVHKITIQTLLAICTGIGLSVSDALD